MNTDTNQLLQLLTQMPPRQRPLRLGALLLLLMILSALLTVLLIGLRPELVAGSPPASFWIKSGLLAAMMLEASRRLAAASKPLAPAPRNYPTFLLAALAGFLMAEEWLTVDAHSIINHFYAENFPACLAAVSLFGGLGMACLTFLMRSYAPAHTKHCASLIGFAAAAAGALGYSIHCPFDSPTFVVVSYSLPMLALALAGRWLLPRFLAW